jgi:D-alanine-D-alanine ligase
MGLRLGLVYDLKEDYLAAGFSPEAVMEFDGEETVSGLAGGLEGLGHRVERIGRGIELARRLAAGERWDLVFSIAEGVKGRSREAQVPGLCELFDQPYVFADPLSCALTLDKAMAKRVVRDHGLPTAPFAVVDVAEQAAAIDLSFPLFVKPVAEGSSKGVTGRSFARSRDDLEDACRTLIATFGQPVLVERYLPGREVTVGLVGEGDTARVVGVMEVSITGGDETHSYTALNKKEWRERVCYRLIGSDDPLTSSAAALAVACYRALGCRDGARLDVRCDDEGTPCFLEANPLPGLNAEWSDLPIIARLAGHDYGELLGWIVASACARYGL